MRVFLLGAIGLLAVTLCGCEQSSQPPAAPAAESAAPPANQNLSEMKDFVKKTGGEPTAARGTTPANPHASAGGAAPPPPLPPGHPPVPGVAAAPAAPAGAANAGELLYEVPSAWQVRPPASAMRKAQFLLPRAGSDGEDGEMVVFFFGRGQGGNVEDNIARWRGQFTTPEGQPIGDDAFRREQIEVNGLKVTVLEITGRYSAAAMMPGGAPAGAKDNQKMLAAIIETPSGNWFIRGSGPVGTMDVHKDSFMQLVRSVKL